MEKKQGNNETTFVLKDVDIKKLETLSALKSTNMERLIQRAGELTSEKNLTWDDINDFIRWLKDKIANKGYVGVYGVPRSGLLLAILLSYQTGLPLLLSPTEKCLVLDNDSVTGLALAPYYGRYDIAVYGIHPECKMEPTYIYSTYEDAVFISYPWLKR